MEKEQSSEQNETFVSEQPVTEGACKIKRKNTIKSILAFICSFFLITALLGLLLAIIDLIGALWGLIFKKKEKRKKHIFSVFALAVLAFMVYTSFNPIQKVKSLLEPNRDIDRSQSKEITAEMKKTPSDIEGMTLYDKLKAGLIPDENSDTDGDGINDKDEIEIYKTNPKKVSTSGDAIPDSVKVSLGLNVKKKYKLANLDLTGTEYENLFSHPECVTINTSKAKNAFADISEHTVYVDGEEAIAGFLLRNVEGKVTIDFSDYITDGDDYIAYIVDNAAGGTVEKLKLKDYKITCMCSYGSCSVGVFKSAPKVNNSLLLIPSGWFGLFFDLFNQGRRTFVMLEESCIGADSNSADRSEEMSSVFTEIMGVPIKVKHKYISVVEYELWKNTLKDKCGGTSVFAWGEYTKNPAYWVICYAELNSSDKSTFIDEDVLRSLWLYTNKTVDGGMIFEYGSDLAQPYTHNYATSCDAEGFCVVHDTWPVLNADVCAGLTFLAARRYNTKFGDLPLNGEEYNRTGENYLDLTKFRETDVARFTTSVDEETARYLFSYSREYPLSELLNPHYDSDGELVSQDQRSENSYKLRQAEYEKKDNIRAGFFLSKGQINNSPNNGIKVDKEIDAEFIEENQNLLAYILDAQLDYNSYDGAKNVLSFEAFNGLKDYLETGRVVKIGVCDTKLAFLRWNGIMPALFSRVSVHGHALLVYDIGQDENDEDIWYLYVYDPNWVPDTIREGENNKNANWDGRIAEYKDKFKIVLTKKKKGYSIKYDPVNDKEYVYDYICPITVDGDPNGKTVEDWAASH